MTQTDNTTPRAEIRPEWLMGVAEVASFFDCNPSTVSNWAARRDDNKMPEPLVTLRCGTIYNIADLLPWWIDWSPVKGRRVGTVDRNLLLVLGLKETIR